MQLLKDIGQWLWSVATIWQAYMTGGIVWAIIGTYERVTQRTISVRSFIYGVIAFLLAAFFFAWREQHNSWLTEQAARAKLETVRPYLVIEELSGDQIRAMVIRNRGNKVLPEGGYDRGYVFAQSPTGEVLFYNVRALPGEIVAHDLRMFVNVALVNADGSRTRIPIDEEKDQSYVILPGQPPLTRAQAVPKGTVFTGFEEPKGLVEIKLTVTFTGQPTDTNVYYYQVLLEEHRYQSSEKMTEHPGGLRTKWTKEGIVADLNRLIG
jgi:hypothetical protein